jgi:hypothetical protein
MDIFTFLTSIFASAAWPVTALVMVLLLRRPLTEILLEIRKLKWGGLEAEFGSELGQARELIDREPGKEPFSLLNDKFPQKSRDFLLKLAELSPRSVILEAWRDVDVAAVKALERHRLLPNSQRLPNTGVAVQTLLDAHLIDDAEFQVFAILRNLRNRAAHDSRFELTKEEAIEYAIMAERLARTLETLNRQRERAS